MKRQFKKMSRKKIVFLFAVFVLGISAPIQIITSNAYATNYEAQLKKLQAEIDANNEKAKKKAEEAGSLKNELAVIDAEKSAAEATLWIFLSFFIKKKQAKAAAPWATLEADTTANAKKFKLLVLIVISVVPPLFKRGCAIALNWENWLT